MFDNLATGSLLSVWHLYNDDCIVLFSKFQLEILKNNELIIEGKRIDNGLWDIPLKKMTTNQPSTKFVANGIIG